MINKNGHLYCEMGKKEQVPALAIFVQGSLWVWSATSRGRPPDNRYPYCYVYARCPLCIRIVICILTDP